MNTLERMDLVGRLYPDFDGGYGPCDYLPILENFGEILLKVDDEDYQGDSRVIYKRGEEYGLLIFGWGSCSGCDALQACGSLNDIAALHEHLETSIRWDSKTGLLHYMNTHDWEGDYSFHTNEQAVFIEKAKAILSE